MSANEEITLGENNTIVSNENTNNASLSSEELLEKGKLLMKDKHFEEAVEILSQALQSIVEKYVDKPKSIDLMEYYLNYGKSLLRLAQTATDVFGEALRNKQEEYTEQEEDDEEKNNDNDNGNEDDNKNNEVPANNTQNKNKENDEKYVEENNNENKDDQTTQPYDTTEDRELAWESLETARLIIEEFLQKSNPNHSEKDLSLECKKYMSILAEIHCLLAESQMEEENFDGGLLDYEKALQLRHICDDSWRELAYIHFMSSLCATYSGKNDVSKQHLQDSVKLLRDRSITLLQSLNININTENENEKENEINPNSQNEKVLSSIEASLNIENLSESLREELKDLQGNMTDLLSKINEEENSKQYEMADQSNKELLNEVIQSMLQGGSNATGETIEEDDDDDEDEYEDGEEYDDDDEENGNSNEENLDADVDVDVDVEDIDVPNENDKNHSGNKADEEENNPETVNKENQNDFTNKNIYGVTTIGFNTDNNDTNDDKQAIHNLGNFGKGNAKKRSFEQADSSDSPQTKKLRLSNSHIDGN